MRRLASRLRRLGWKWRLAIAALMIVLIIVVVVPTVIYYSRDRDPFDYSDTPDIATTKYIVNYDSGDGVVNDSEYTLKVIEAGVEKGSETCFHTAIVFESYPDRKVNAIIVGPTKITLAEEELWLSQDNLRIVHKEVMQMNLPIVNTAVTQITYSKYEEYPDWPYHLNDSWTYEIFYEPDTFMQPSWTDKFHAIVVKDDAIVKIGDAEYQCFKVVHTLTDTTNGTPPGDGIGGTLIEYWHKDGKPIAPVKIENSFSYKGTETRIAIGNVPSAINY
ncbi:hypothetical protein ACFLVL_01540 [Chloroflexota bacterium]